MATLFDVALAQAVEEISEHGFDSTARLEALINKLRQAAVASLIPESQVQERLTRSLQSLYNKYVNRRQLLKLHEGVSQFTIERVAPRLRADLDRRILASASLIKRNREDAVAQTIKRFEGWSTSVPPGGSKAIDKTKTKYEIGKSLKQLAFEERRVLIDQGQKFVAGLSDTLAVGGGAIAGIWRSRYRQAGYNYREDHKELDGQVFVVRGNWALERGLIKLAGAQYMDQIEKPAEARVLPVPLRIHLQSARSARQDADQKGPRRAGGGEA